MTIEHARFDSIVILADGSANWKIAGLRQLERLVLDLNEFAEGMRLGGKIDIVVFWKPEIPPPQRWLPKQSRITRVCLREPLVSLEPGARILTTRLFVERNGLATFFQTTPIVKFEQAIVDLPGAWRQFFEQFERTCRSVRADEEKGWHFLADSSDIAVSEQQLLRRTGKSQDGLVSRFLNRPISRFVTRILIKYPITPSMWTLSILILPLAAFFFLLRGDYAGFVAGAAFFQLYSIVDGCDGEIARAKYLESESGARFDTWCDIIGNLLLVLGVGLGLGQQHSTVYVAEGVVCAALIASNEWFLHRPAAKSDEAANSIGGALYPRHRALVEQMSLMLLGDKIVWWLFQVTKRDVAILFFLCLAIINQPQWILHLSLIVGGVSLALSGVAHGRRLDLRA